MTITNHNMENTVKVQLDTHYTRSIHLERDAKSSDILKAYIPTSRAIQTLSKITDTFTTQAMPRAWSLIGPYGSGKSSFAAFLSHLLESSDSPTHHIAKDLLKTHQPHLAEKITSTRNNYCVVLLTGSPESLSQRFIEALYSSALRYWGEEQKPAVIEALKQARLQAVTTTEVIDLLEQLQQAVIEKSGQGILIIIDELGKFLEYEARHQGTNDIYLLQAIAELACEGNTANILLVVLMHQAFEQYAKGLGETSKTEWLKIQGRFESIAFLESAEQTLRVMAAAFRNELSAQEKQKIHTDTADIIAVLDKQNALPNGLNPETATSILAKCYPLHPIAAVCLPTLCQKVAQNERTLFSYLGSQENFGFKDGMNRLTQVGEWVLPWQIFQYFIENQPLATTDHITHRRWAEVLTAIERLGDTDLLTLQLLKTIGLFNIIGSQAGFKASKELLIACFPNNDINESLSQLQNKSIINYHRYNLEYRIWQGSDFDLNIAVKETQQHTGEFELADILERRHIIRPILARKYSIQNTLLRYFQPHYADAATKKDFFAHIKQPSIIFFLAENTDDKAALQKITQTYNNPLIIYICCDNAEIIKSVVSEAQALEHIQYERPEIKSDPVAQRELKDYLCQIKQKESELLNDYLEHPNLYSWYWQSEPLKLSSRKELQNQLSTVLETVYNKAPLIKNELINRNKSSGQANAAKNKLIAALLNNAHLEDLGFDKTKYPAEKTIYRALFKATGLHVEKNGIWQLVTPNKNEYQIYKVWQGIDDFLNSIGTKPLTELYKLIESPPYGVLKGVTSLIFIAYYLTNQRTLALYESGVFCPLVTLENFEILVKRPELFSIEAVNLSGIKAELFEGYLETLVGKKTEEHSLLDIIKPLANFIHKLPEYTKKTKSLDAKTIAVRDAFQQTASPIKLLFETLPKACGYDSYLNTDDFNKNPNEFLTKLANHLNKLNKAYDNLLRDFQSQLTAALKEPADLKLNELRNELIKKYAGLEKYSTDLQGLNTFINRLKDNKDSDKAWLESVATFLGKAPPNKWVERNKSDAEYRLHDFSSRLLPLARVHSCELKNTEATVFRMVNKQGEKDEIVYLTEELKNQAKSVVNAFKNENKQLKLAIIAEFMNSLD